MHNPQVELLIR